MHSSRLFLLICATWVASEIALGVRLRAGTGTSSRDRGSLALLWIAITAAAYCGGVLSGVPATRIAGHWAFPTGLALIVAGIAVRWTAILTLRRYFTVNVTIQPGHELIDRGIYAVVRHPSYSGALISFAGLGLAFGNWLSLAVVMGITLAALSYRISVEERALTEHFGDRYREYARRTKRLIPGVY